MYSIYKKGKNDKCFKAGWSQTDSFEKADEWLDKTVKYDNEHGRRGTKYQIRNGRKILREVEN